MLASAKGSAQGARRVPPTVCAVVVTHNRRELLEQCLTAVAAQTRHVDRVLVVDNASTDGTADLVRDRHPTADLLALRENVGGAGGFHEGMRTAWADGADWIWLMDDDTMPRPDALAELLAVPERIELEPSPLLLASKVVWTDGTLHPMNAPGLDRTRADLVVEASEHALLPLRTATFVSLLVHRSAVDRYGLPLKHFFIWSDDIEYTARVLRRRERGYLVPGSIAEHRTKAPYTATESQGGRFYYHVRNTLYMLRSDSWKGHEKLSLAYMLLRSSFEFLLYNRFARREAAVVLRGVRDGLRPAPAQRPVP